MITSQLAKLKYLNLVEKIMSYYAVAKGRQPGIYKTWDECQKQVHKFPKPVFKKFKTEQEATDFIEHNSSSSAVIPCSSLILPSKKTKRQISSLSESENDEVAHTKKKKIDNQIKKNEYIVDEDGYTEVYTDGACSANGKNGAKAGVGVWFYDDCPWNVSQQAHGRQTNNNAEIEAVTIAAKKAYELGIKKLKICTDSKFLINCFTKWMPNWKRNGWKTSSGASVLNKEELLQMEKALAPLKIKWNHVRGHVGVYGNEKADKLAVAGAKK